jgi:hypothetical protein
LTINVFTAERASPSADALNLLASWAATLDTATGTHDHVTELPRT